MFWKSSARCRGVTQGQWRSGLENRAAPRDMTLTKDDSRSISRCTALSSDGRQHFSGRWWFCEEDKTRNDYRLIIRFVNENVSATVRSQTHDEHVDIWQVRLAKYSITLNCWLRRFWLKKIVRISGFLVYTGTGVFTIGPLGPCPPPLSAVDRKCSKLKISHTAVSAARVAKQRRQIRQRLICP